MKVLFIVEPFTVEPLGIAYLASALKKAGHEPELLRVDNGWIGQVKKIKPRIYAYSVTTGKHRKFLFLNKLAKSVWNALSIFGGSHPTYFPEFVNEQGVDVIVRGEADKSFVELLNDVQIKHSCKNVVNFRILEEEIDRISFPDREFLYKYPENRNNPIKNVITSRGCRFNCPYCFNSLYREFYQGQNWVRYRSPDNVIRECIELKKYPLKLIYFQDDEFLTNPNLEEFLDKYKEEVKVPFHCQIRIELLTEDKARKLKDAGCNGVTFAVESGNDYLRQEILNRKISKEKIISNSALLQKVGLKFRIENMCGIPGENLKQMFETLDLNIKCKPTIGWCSIFQPYPKLPLGEYARKCKFWDGGLNDIKETFFEDTILETPIKKQIANFQRLFGLTVSYPILKKILWHLIKLPKNKVFDSIHLKWKQHLYRKLYDYK